MEGYESTPPCQYVVIRRNGNDGRRVNLDYVSTAIFGSEVDCDVRIRQDSVLPQHASVQVDEKGRVFASSFNSENPASLNGEPVSKDVYIRNNDVLKIGDKSFRFEYLRTVLSPINPNTYRQATPKAKKNAGLIPKSPKTSSRTPETKKSPARVITPRRKEPEDCTTNRKPFPATPVPVLETSMVKDSTSCTNSEGCPGTPTVNSGSAQRRTPQTAPVKSMTGNRTQSYRQRRSMQAMLVPDEETKISSPTVNSKPQECILCPATPEGKSILSITRTPQSAPTQTKPNKSADSQKRLSWAPIQAVPDVKPSSNGASRKSGSKRLSSPSVESSSTFTPHFKSTPYPSSTECRNPTPMPTSVGDSFRSRRSSCTRSVSLLTSIQEESHASSSPCNHIATPNKALFQDSVKTAKIKSSKRKSVTFGPQLSPEYFDKRLPSKTPIKRGSLPGYMQCSLEPQSFGIAADLPFSLGKVEEENSSSDISLINSDQENFDNMSTMAQCSSPLPPNISMPNLGESNESSLNPSPGVTSSDLDSSYCSIGELSASFFIGEASLEDLDTKSTLPTPTERKAVKAMPTPVRKDIEKRPNLRSLRSQRHCLPSPVRRAIEDRPSLQRLVRKMDTPLRKQIRSQPKLRKTKKSTPTPLRKDIQNPPELRKTKKSMPTPLRKDIQNPPELHKTKNSMPTPLRKDIQNPSELRKTKKSLPTPLKNDIQNPPELHKTKKSMPTPLKNDIQNPPELRKTKKRMPTPLRKDIQNPPALRKSTRLLNRKRGYDYDGVDEVCCYPSAAKRRRLAPVRRNNRSQNDCYEFDGLQELFSTPQPPVKVFDPSLFLSPINRSNKVQFLSPVAKTAKKQLPREQSIPSKPIIKFASVPISDEFVFVSSNLQRTRSNTKKNAKKHAPKTKDMNDEPAPCKRTTRSSVKAANSDKVSSVPIIRSRTKREVSEEVTVPMAKRKQTQKSSVDNSSISDTAVMSTRRTRSQSKQEIPNVGETRQLRSSQSQSTSEMQPSNTRRSTRSNPSLVEPEQTIVRSGKKRSSTVKPEVTPSEIEPPVKRTRSSRKCTEDVIEPKPLVRRSARLAKK